MPIHSGKDSNGPFIQWGHQKKYYYKAGNKKSLAAAKAKAKKQMNAIFASGYHEDVNSPLKKFNLLVEEIVNNILFESLETCNFFIADSKKECIDLLLSLYKKDSNSKHDLLNDDLSNMIYCKHEFEWMSIQNPNIKYFILFDQNHLVGLLKFWLKGSNTNLPTIGYISINNQFKHQGYGTFLIKKCLEYHKENFGDLPLILTEYSDEGEPYIKHVIERKAKELNIEIFMFDDIRKLYEKFKYKAKNVEFTYPPSEKNNKIID